MNIESVLKCIFVAIVYNVIVNAVVAIAMHQDRRTAMRLLLEFVFVDILLILHILFYFRRSKYASEYTHNSSMETFVHTIYKFVLNEIQL